MRRAARGPKRVGFRLHGLEGLAQAHDPGACREQHLADIVLRLQDFLAALAQALVIEAEHTRVKAAIRAGKKRRERPLARRNRRVIVAQQRVLVALAAANLERIASLLQERAHAHGVVLVQEVAGRVGRDAEEQVFDTVHRRGLSGFILAKQHLKVRLACRQSDDGVREVTVSKQIKLSDAHDYTFSAARRALRYAPAWAIKPAMLPSMAALSAASSDIRADIVGQFADEIAEIRREPRLQLGVAASALDHALQVAQCVLARWPRFQGSRSQ